MNGILLDRSGMSRAEKRAALLARQDGRCACCGLRGALQADHDHATGLLRGMLLPSCNVREGRFSSALYDIDHAGIAAYLAAPPASGLGWMWDLPSWWAPADTREVSVRGITVHEYVTAHYLPTTARYLERLTTDCAVSALASASLPPLG